MSEIERTQATIARVEAKRDAAGDPESHWVLRAMPGRLARPAEALAGSVSRSAFYT
jgi:hypothetical protein